MSSYAPKAFAPVPKAKVTETLVEPERVPDFVAPQKKINLREILYPLFNTVRLDDPDTLDGRPYQEGVNLLGPRREQYRWDMDAERNALSAIYIDPGGRMVVEKQEQFYDAIFHYPEVFFGGAAGGTKSHALMQSHLVKHISWAARGITGQTTAMFCETKEELERRHIINLFTRIPSWMGWYDSKRMIFHFHKRFGGGVIMFLYVGHGKREIERLLSYEFSYITIDELTRNSQYVYQFITSRLRSTKVPSKEWCVASASNPGSIGHKWVYKHFVNKRTRLFDLATKGERRCFIQALAKDNPIIPAYYYEKQLAKLPKKVQDAYRNANWMIYEGQYFDMLDETVHIIPRFNVPDEVTKYRGIDHGGSHPTACVWVARFPPTDEHPNGRLVVYRYYEAKDKWADKHKAAIAKLSKGDKNLAEWTSLSHEAFNVKGSTTGDLTVAERYNAHDKDGSFGVIRSTRDRKGRWQLLANLLSFESSFEVTEQGKLVERKIVTPPQLYFVDTPDVRMLYEELQALLHDPNDPEDVEFLGKSEYDVGFGDDGPDALGYCLMGMGIGLLVSDHEPEFEPKPFDPRRDAMNKYRGTKGMTYADF